MNNVLGTCPSLGFVLPPFLVQYLHFLGQFFYRVNINTIYVQYYATKLEMEHRCLIHTQQLFLPKLPKYLSPQIGGPCCGTASQIGIISGLIKFHGRPLFFEGSRAVTEAHA